MAMRAGPGEPVTRPAWPFVGRDEELEWIAVARREPSCCGVVVSGAAGVGKTRLAREALAAAAAEGCVTEWVQATRAAASIPLGALAGLLPDGAGAGDRLQVFQHCAQALRERAAGERVVLGVDDAQLLDAGSAALVLHLAAGRTAFLVVTVRVRERCPDSIVALWKDLEAPRLELQQLSEEETGQLLEAALDSEVAGDVRRWAYEASEGHVLYLRELVNGALASGTLVNEEVSWHLRGRPPVSPALAELISLGLEELSDEQLATARLLALGEPLELDTLTPIVGPEPLAVLETRGLAVVTAAPPGRGREARLAHPLYGEIVRAELPTLRGADLRRRLAESTRARGLTRAGDALRVATWLDEAGDELDEQLLLAAARDADAAGDPQLAEGFARRATPSPEQVLILGRSCASQHRFAEAEAAFADVEAMIPTQERELALDYLFWRAEQVLQVGLHRWDDAFALIERARSWFEDSEWQARVEGLRIVMLVDPGEGLAAIERLLERDDVPADVRRRLSVSRVYHLPVLGRLAEAYPLAEEVRPSLDQPGPVDANALAAWCRVRELGGYDWDELDRWLAEAERAIGRIDPSMRGLVLIALERAAVRRGRPASAVRRAQQAIDEFERFDPHDSRSVAWLWAAIGAAMQRDVEAAHAALQAYEDALAGPHPGLWRQDATARAMLLAAEGDTGRAVATLFDTVQSHEDRPVECVLLLHEAFRLGAPAGTVAPGIARAAAGCDGPLPTALAGLVAAAAADDGQALLDSATEIGAIGAWLWAAEAAALAADAFRREGREDSARRATALTGRYLDECENAWSPLLEHLALAPAELTQREREIVALAASGASNAEIAERLTLSVRTVETHLYRAMRKLGVTTRQELPGPPPGRDAARPAPSAPILQTKDPA